MNLQISHYETLEVLGVIFAGLETEREVQRRFKHLHVRGEWFRETEELTEYINANAVPDK